MRDFSDLFEDGMYVRGGFQENNNYIIYFIVFLILIFYILNDKDEKNDYSNRKILYVPFNR